MTEAVKIALIVAAVPTLGTVVNTWLSHKIFHATNSMKDELVRLAREEGHTAGVAAQKKLSEEGEADKP